MLRLSPLEKSELNARLVYPALAACAGAVRDELALTSMVSMAVAVAGVDSESVTSTVKLTLPEAVGVPLMVPPLESESPAGSDPEARLHLYGDVPPVADSVAEYALP